MGSFGPEAYLLSHLEESDNKLGSSDQIWIRLREANDRLAKSRCYTLFDSFHSGCGGSIAAIKAGIFVQAGAGWAVE